MIPANIIALLGIAVLITYSPQNGLILLLMAFLIGPMGLPLAAIWLLGKVQDLKYTIQDRVYGWFLREENPFKKDKKQDIGLSSIVLLLAYFFLLYKNPKLRVGCLVI